MVALVLVLGVLAALLYALSDFLEQRAASSAARRESAKDSKESRDGEETPAQGEESPDDGRHGGSRLAGLLSSVSSVFQLMLHDRRWLAGWAVGTLAYFVQAAALHYGSVAVVQSLQVTTLLFALPLSTVGRAERPRLPDWLSGVALCAGLALFLASRGPALGHAQADRGRIIVILVVIGIGLAAIVTASTLTEGPPRAALLAFGAGAGFATSATLVKLTTADLTTVGIPGTATDWPGYSLALATGTGLVLQQASFASGRLATATTVMVVTNPLVGTVVAVLGFHESMPHGGLRLIGLGLGAALIVAGVTGLAHSPLVRRREDEPARPEPARSG